MDDLSQKRLLFPSVSVFLPPYLEPRCKPSFGVLLLLNISAEHLLYIFEMRPYALFESSPLFNFFKSVFIHAFNANSELHCEEQIIEYGFMVLISGSSTGTDISFILVETITFRYIYNISRLSIYVIL